MQVLLKKIEALVISVSMQSQLALVKTVSERGGKTGIVFHLHPTTPLFTQKGERLGVTAIPVKSKITAYVDSRKPLPMMHPPQVTPLLIIIEQSGIRGEVAIGVFDGNLYSEQLKLKLHVNEESQIMDLKGHRLSVDEAKNKFLYVFYDATTRSIPAQANPKKIFVVTEDQLAESE